MGPNILVPVNNYSQEQSLSFSPRFCKFESKLTTELCGLDYRMFTYFQNFLNTENIWRIGLSTFLKIVGDY